MLIHYFDIEFDDAVLSFNNNNIDIDIKASFLRTTKHREIEWKDITHFRIKEHDDSAITLSIKFNKKDVELTTKKESYLPKRKKTAAQVELLSVYYESKK